MAIALVQTTSAAGATTAITTAAFAGNTTTNNLIIVMYGSSAVTDNNVKSVTDTGGSVYSKILSKRSGGNQIEVWYSNAIIGGVTPTITVNVTTASGQGGVIAREYSGLATKNALDRYLSAITSTNPALSGTPAKTQAPDELVFGAITCGSSTAPTVGSGFANFTGLVAGVFTLAIEDKIVSVTGEYNATFVNSASSSTEVAVVCLSATQVSQPTLLNNYQQLKVGDGMSVSEKIR